MSAVQIKKTILIFFVLLLAVSCAKNESESHSSNSQPLVSVQDLNNDLSPEFVTLAKLSNDDSAAENAERFKYGCTENHSNSNERHPKASIGDSAIEEVRQNSADLGHVKFTLKHSILGTLGSETDLNTRALSFEIEEAGGEVLGQHIDSAYKCTEQKCETYSFPLDLSYLTPTGQGYVKDHFPKNGSGNNFNIRNISNTEVKTEKGIYKMKDQTTLIAYKTTVISTGQIFKGNLLLGQGQQVTIYIKSNDIVAVNTYNYCGGANVYFGMTYKVNDLSVDSFRSEILSAPLILEHQ